MQPSNRNKTTPIRTHFPHPIQEEDQQYTPTQHQPAQQPQARKELSAEQLAALKECFEKFSSTKTLKKPPRSKLNAYGVREIMTSEPEVDVTISEKELSQLFTEASMPLHKQTLSFIYAQLSTNKKGKGISFEDLLQVIQQPCGSQESASDYQNMFKVYDRKSRGYFDHEDYRFVCEGIAKDLTQGQIREAFDCMDKQRSNSISFERFVEVMKGLR